MTENNAITHNFQQGNIILQILDGNRVQQYYVESVISPLKIKVRLYDEQGRLTHSSRTLYGNNLKTLVLDAVATNMRNELNAREGIR